MKTKLGLLYSIPANRSSEMDPRFLTEPLKLVFSYKQYLESKSALKEV